MKFKIPKLLLYDKSCQDVSLSSSIFMITINREKCMTLKKISRVVNITKFDDCQTFAKIRKFWNVCYFIKFGQKFILRIWKRLKLISLGIYTTLMLFSSNIKILFSYLEVMSKKCNVHTCNVRSPQNFTKFTQIMKYRNYMPKNGCIIVSYYYLQHLIKLFVLFWVGFKTCRFCW